MGSSPVQWYISCKKFTCLVETRDPPNNIIIGGAPIIQRFIGKNLHWLMVQFKVDVAVPISVGRK